MEELREKTFCCLTEDDDKTEKQGEVDNSFDSECFLDDLNSSCKALSGAKLLRALNLIIRRFELLMVSNVLEKKVTDYFK